MSDCIHYHLCKDEQNTGVIKEAKEWAGELLSGQTKVSYKAACYRYLKYIQKLSQAGKLLNGIIFVISICSQLTYFYDAQQGLLEKCLFSFPITLQVSFNQ